jgi:hypothetical protein
MTSRRPVIRKVRPRSRQGYEPSCREHGLLSVRSALVLSLALLAALGGAGLLFAAHRSPPLIALGAGAIFAAALQLLNSVIER